MKMLLAVFQLLGGGFFWPLQVFWPPGLQHGDFKEVVPKKDQVY